MEALSRLIVRIFFRRIEIVGRDNIPANGPVIIALNHPNGLVDPLCILAHAPRRISFLSKEPLFRMPVVKYFVTALECLPVYRRQDRANPRENLKTLQAARELLARGGVIALFPEGISHDQPQLQSLKTGAARIALGAQSLLAADAQHSPGVQLLPAGLYYTSRGIFRSDVVVVYGTPIEVAVVELDATSIPPRAAVLALTQQLADSLRALTVNARDSELITLAATAARLIDNNSPTDEKLRPLQRRLQIMQQILAGHEALLHENPALALALVERLRRYETLLNRYGLGLTGTTRPGTGQALRHVLLTFIGTAILSPLLVPGIVVNYLPYRVVGQLARRFANDGEDIVSTLKVLSGMALFPLTWLTVSLALWWLGAPRLSASQLLLAPLSAGCALWFLDRATSTATGLRVLWLYWTRPRRYAELRREGQAIAEQLLLVEPG